jgi:hypothetical protein
VCRAWDRPRTAAIAPRASCRAISRGAEVAPGLVRLQAQLPGSGLVAAGWQADPQDLQDDRRCAGLASGGEGCTEGRHDAAPTRTTLGESAEQWLAAAKAEVIRTRSGEPYKPSALRAYEEVLRARVMPKLGHMRVSSVTRNTIRIWSTSWWQGVGALDDPQLCPAAAGDLPAGTGALGGALKPDPRAFPTSRRGPAGANRQALRGTCPDQSESHGRSNTLIPSDSTSAAIRMGRSWLPRASTRRRCPPTWATRARDDR